jgi:hypothetical protein
VARFLKLCVALLLVMAAGANADWVRGPVTRISGLNVAAYTGQNNSRSIAECDGRISVVYVQDTMLGSSVKAVYYRTSTDNGANWCQPLRLSEFHEQHVRDPSVVAWSSDAVAVTWSSGDDGSGHAMVAYSRNNFGDPRYTYNWHDRKLVSDDNEYWHEWACHPSLFCESGYSPVFCALWGGSNSYYFYPQNICFKFGEPSEGDWYVSSPIDDDPPADLWDASMKFTDSSECPSGALKNGLIRLAYQKDTTEETGQSVSSVRYANMSLSNLTNWEEDISEGYSWPFYTVASSGRHPSFSCDGTHELIAYEQGDQVRVLHRSYPNIGGDTSWYDENVTTSWWADSARRPSAFISQGGTFGLAFTAYRRGSTTKGISYMYSTDGGSSWTTYPYPNGMYICSDSVSIATIGSPISTVPCRFYLLSGRVWDADASRVFFRMVTSTLNSSPLSSGPNGAGKLARQPGTNYLHRVHPIENFISYERSSDNGVTWDYQDAPDYGTNPTIALSNGNPTIAYLRGGDSVMAATLNSDSEWTIRTLFAGTSTSVPGVPSLAMFSNTTGRPGNVCFPLYDAGTGHSKIIYIQFDTTGASGVKQNTVDDFANSFADSACCVAAFSTDTAEVVYQHGGMVLMRRLCYSSTTSDPPPDTWPASSQVSTGTTSGARHPFCEKIGSRLWVTYSQQYQDGGQDYWVIKEVSCNDGVSTVTWEGLTEKSGNNAYPTDFPTLSTSKVVAWGESSSTTNHWVVKADVADSLYLTLSNPDTNCRFVSILADTAVQSTPSTSTTGVYYMWLQQVAGETSAVQYASQQFLTSNADANVTMYNQGSKLALDNNDSLSSIYRTLQGSIRYARKKDGVEGWNSSLLRNTGDMPCLDCDYLNRVYVADRDFSGSKPTHDVILCQTRSVGGTWDTFQVYSSEMPAGSNAHKIGPPAIVACRNDTGGQNRSAAYIVFTVYEPNGAGFSTTMMAKVSPTGVIYVDTLATVMGKGDSFPSIAIHPTAGQGYGLHVAWQSGAEVYVKKTLNQDQPQFTTKRLWSNSYNLSNSLPFLSRHPYIAADTDSVMVAWVMGDSGRVLVKGQAPGSNYSFWGDTVNVSKCQDTVADYPSIALGDSIIVTYQKKLSSTNYDVIARVNFHSNLNITNSSTNSKYPHCLFHLHDGSPVISTVWTEELSTNYAEVGYKRWQLGEEGGGGTQSASVFDPSIRPMLYAPSPNPFAGTTTIRYQTNIQGRTSVVIHDVTGRKVCNLMTTYQRPGIYNLTWTGRDDRQRLLPEGIYFVRLQTPNYSEARKLILTQ